MQKKSAIPPAMIVAKINTQPKSLPKKPIKNFGNGAIMLSDLPLSPPKKSTKIAAKPTQKIKPTPIKTRAYQGKNLPVHAKITQKFSLKQKHSGLTFGTKAGQKVRAIRDGKIVYVGNIMKSHGKMIIIRHAFGFYSSYTQNQKLMVASGDSVKKGQVISLTNAQPFYFEMSKFKKTIDPTQYLK